MGGLVSRRDGEVGCKRVEVKGGKQVERVGVETEKENLQKAAEHGL